MIAVAGGIVLALAFLAALPALPRVLLVGAWFAAVLAAGAGIAGYLLAPALGVQSLSGLSGLTMATSWAIGFLVQSWVRHRP